MGDPAKANAKQIRGRRDDMLLLPALRHLMESEEYHHRIVFVVEWLCS